MWAWRSPPPGSRTSGRGRVVVEWSCSGRGRVAAGRTRKMGLANPAGEALAAAGWAVGRPEGLGGWGATGDGGGRGPHEPGVDGDAVAAGGLLDAGLELLGEPEVDPGGGAVVVDRRRLGRQRGRDRRHGV